MDEIKLITFCTIYSRSKLQLVDLYKKLHEHAKTYGYLTVKDYVRIWQKIPEGKEALPTQSASDEWGVTVHDFPAKISIKKHPINGYYLSMPSTYLL